MTKPVKLFWDFRGPHAAATASHFLEHLKEYPLDPWEGRYGLESPAEGHTAVFLIVPEEAVKSLKHALKPHRGIYLEAPEEP